MLIFFTATDIFTATSSVAINTIFAIIKAPAVLLPHSKFNYHLNPMQFSLLGPVFPKDSDLHYPHQSHRHRHDEQAGRDSRPHLKRERPEQALPVGLDAGRGHAEGAVEEIVGQDEVVALQAFGYDCVGQARYEGGSFFNLVGDLKVLFLEKNRSLQDNYSNWY